MGLYCTCVTHVQYNPHCLSPHPITLRFSIPLLLSPLLPLLFLPPPLSTPSSDLLLPIHFSIPLSSTSSSFLLLLLPPQVTLEYMKHMWKSGDEQKAFDLLGKFVNQLHPRDNHEQIPQDTSQLLAQ